MKPTRTSPERTTSASVCENFLNRQYCTIWSVVDWTRMERHLGSCKGILQSLSSRRARPSTCQKKKKKKKTLRSWCHTNFMEGNTGLRIPSNTSSGPEKRPMLEPRSARSRCRDPGRLSKLSFCECYSYLVIYFFLVFNWLRKTVSLYNHSTVDSSETIWNHKTQLLSATEPWLRSVTRACGNLNLWEAGCRPLRRKPSSPHFSTFPPKLQGF